MTILTISRKLTRGAELVVIPRQDYEKLLATRLIPTFRPTVAERKELVRARKNLARGNFLTLDELKHKLGFTG